MSNSEKAVKSVFIIIIFTFGSKILGFIREVLIAAKFGSGVETDTFFIALTATTLFTSMFTETLKTTMIPILSEVEHKEGKIGKKNHVNNLFNIVFIISFIVVVLGWILSPFIIRILAAGFEGEQFKLAVLLMRMGLPVIFFAGALGVYRGYLQSELMFTESAATQIPFNFTYIIFLLFMSSLFGIKGLMVTSVIAVASQLLYQILGLKKIGYNYRFVLDLKDRYVRKIMYLVAPVLVSVSISDLNKIVDRSLASTLVSGSVSALNYGNRLKTLVLGIFITAITTVIFPTLSKEANKVNYEGFKKTMGYGINIILLITIPATMGMIILAEPIVRVAFERGAFNSSDTIMTTGALIFYTLGLAGMGLKSFLNRVYYSLQDTKTPMVNGFIAVAINIVLNLIFIQFMEHRGLALATSISATITTGLLLYGLKKKIGQLGTIRFIKCGIKSLFASSIMGVVVYLLYSNLENIISGSTIIELLVLTISAALGAIIYLIIIYFLKVEEMNWFIELLKKNLRKK